MKKLLLTTAIALCTLPSLAQDAISDKEDLSGFYTGIHGGYAISKASQSITAHGAHISKKIPLEGITGGLQVGYNKQISQRFVIGGEIYGNISSASGDEKYSAPGVSSVYTSYKNLYGFGLAVKGGVKVDRALPYIKLGYERTCFSLKRKIEHALPAPHTTSSSGKEWMNSFLLGFGVNFAINDKISVGTEFNYLLHQHNEDAFKNPRTSRVLLNFNYTF